MCVYIYIIVKKTIILGICDVFIKLAEPAVCYYMYMNIFPFLTDVMEEQDASPDGRVTTYLISKETHRFSVVKNVLCVHYQNLDLGKRLFFRNINKILKLTKNLSLTLSVTFLKVMMVIEYIIYCSMLKCTCK